MYATLFPIVHVRKPGLGSGERDKTTSDTVVLVPVDGSKTSISNRARERDKTT
jgi:hypothetical protein